MSSYGLQPPDWFDNSWSSSGGSGSNVATKAAESTSGTDDWGGFFKGLLSQGVNYAMQRDAAKTGIQMQQAAAQPVYITQPAGSSSMFAGMSPLVMVGALAVGGVVLVMALRK